MIRPLSRLLGRSRPAASDILLLPPGMAFKPRGLAPEDEQRIREIVREEIVTVAPMLFKETVARLQRRPRL